MMKTIAALALTAATDRGRRWPRKTRDPAYQAARSAGQVGEQTDGYLGVVGAQPAAITALVNSINIQRKALYTTQQRAGGIDGRSNSRFTTGCNLILKTVPGEKYELPGGGWATRTAAAPTRDPRCV